MAFIGTLDSILFYRLLGDASSTDVKVGSFLGRHFESESG